MMKAWKDAFFLLTKEAFDDCGGSQKIADDSNMSFVPSEGLAYGS